MFWMCATYKQHLKKEEDCKNLMKQKYGGDETSINKKRGGKNTSPLIF